MKIFCDGVYDLFHIGHVNHFEKIKKLYPESYLLVGILNDEETTKYKRKPIFNEEKRKDFVDSCKYVDETTFDYPAIITEEFMNKNNIDLVVHAFSDSNDFEKQLKFFKYPIEKNKFLKIDYDKSISSTEILKKMNLKENNSDEKNLDKEGWDLIWEKKGKTDDDDPIFLNGYEETKFNPLDCVNEIINQLKIKKGDKILEVGPGAGLLSKYFIDDYNYFGIDYSSSLVMKNIKLYNSKIFNCEARKLPFKDKYFDFIFSVCVFEYFPTKEYMREVLNEIDRVSKKGVYILNLRKVTHTSKKVKHKFEGVFKHIIYNEDDFPGYKVLESSYEKTDRFSVIKFLK